MLTQYKETLPNPHKDYIREILTTLICYDNDVRCLNGQIRELQKEYKEEVDAIECRCAELRAPSCDTPDKILEFRNHIAVVEEVKRCFTKKLHTMEQKRDEILKASKILLTEFQKSKCRLKLFHDKTVDHLQRIAIGSTDVYLLHNCEKDICEMEKLLQKELIFIKKSENALEPFIKRLMGEDYEAYKNCCCFKEFKWLPKPKGLEALNDIVCQIKTQMGNTLTKAFADMHIHQPADPKFYLAAYLMNVDRNEKAMKEKMKVFGNAPQVERKEN